MSKDDFKYFEAGDVRLQSGLCYRRAKLAYKTYGKLDAARSNVIVYPTSFSAQHYDTEWLIGPGGVLDSDKYFIVIPNMFGNGLSSSPSNTPPPFDRGRYPHFTCYDNVQVQRRMLRELYGVETVKLVYGWSMGGMQAYHWAALFPEAVERIAVVCAAARVAPHNFVFLEGVKAALTADPAWRDGWFEKQPLRGLRAMGRIYAGWAMSQTWYRQELWRSTGHASLEDYLVASWEGNFLRRDANDLLAHIWTWQHGDISANELYQGKLEAALGAIRAKVLLMPSASDLYFTVADNEAELPQLRDARLRVMPSVWGHRAGNPAGQREDTEFIRREVGVLLAE